MDQLKGVGLEYCRRTATGRACMALNALIAFVVLHNAHFLE